LWDLSGLRGRTQWNIIAIPVFLPVFNFSRQVMFNHLKSRFPDKQSIVNVFATAAFIVYGWTIYSSFWKIPSWLFYLRLSEIFSVYAYSFLVNFVESILLTLGVIFLGFLLFGNLWKEGFISAGVVTLAVLVGSALVHMRLYENPDLRVEFINSQLRWWTITFFLVFVVSFICVRIPWMKSLLENLADRFVVFLYIYMPLTLLSLGIVVVRIAL
jgi:hypothetical protein